MSLISSSAFHDSRLAANFFGGKALLPSFSRVRNHCLDVLSPLGVDVAAYDAVVEVPQVRLPPLRALLGAR